VSGLAVTLLAMGLNLLPIVNVANKLVFGAKVAVTSTLLNLVGMAIYWNGTQRKAERR
jgi:hypothetical protein